MSYVLESISGFQMVKMKESKGMRDFWIMEPFLTAAGQKIDCIKMCFICLLFRSFYDGTH